MGSVFTVALIPQPPVLRGSDASCKTTMIQEKHPKLRDPETFLAGSERTCPLFWRIYCLCLPRLFTKQTPLKRQSGEEAASRSSHRTCKKVKHLRRQSPNNIYSRFCIVLVSEKVPMITPHCHSLGLTWLAKVRTELFDFLYRELMKTIINNIPGVILIPTMYPRVSDSVSQINVMNHEHLP